MAYEDEKLFENLSYDWSEDSSRIIHTAALQIKESFLYIQEAGYFKTYPTYYAERANLHSFLITYTLSGEGCLNYRGYNYKITPGKFFWIDCTEHHKYYCGSDGWEFLWLHFYGVSAKGYYNIFNRDGITVIDAAGFDGIEKYFRELVELASKIGLNADIKASGLINNLLSEVLLKSSLPEVSSLDVPGYILPILRYLDHSFAEKISLDLLARQFGISKYYLSREFKKYIGCTIWDYLTNQRIAKSKELLRYTDKPVHEIAQQCGFNQTPYFIQTFRQHEGVTPLAYRKMWS